MPSGTVSSSTGATVLNLLALSLASSGLSFLRFCSLPLRVSARPSSTGLIA